jgi:hypothetical protein
MMKGRTPPSYNASHKMQLHAGWVMWSLFAFDRGFYRGGVYINGCVR